MSCCWCGGGCLTCRGFSLSEPSLSHGYCQCACRMRLECTCSSVLLQNSTHLRLITAAPLLWLTITTLHSTSQTPHHTHFHTHTLAHNTPTAPLLPKANHAHQLANVKTTQSGTDQTGNGFTVQHVALSFVWRDPAAVSDCMQRAKARINSLVTFVVVPCSV